MEHKSFVYADTREYTPTRLAICCWKSAHDKIKTDADLNHRDDTRFLRDMRENDYCPETGRWLGRKDAA